MPRQNYGYPRETFLDTEQQSTDPYKFTQYTLSRQGSGLSRTGGLRYPMPRSPWGAGIPPAPDPVTPDSDPVTPDVVTPEPAGPPADPTQSPMSENQQQAMIAGLHAHGRTIGQAGVFGGLGGLGLGGGLAGLIGGGLTAALSATLGPLGMVLGIYTITQAYNQKLSDLESLETSDLARGKNPVISQEEMTSVDPEMLSMHSDIDPEPTDIMANEPVGHHTDPTPELAPPTIDIEPYVSQEEIMGHVSGLAGLGGGGGSIGGAEGAGSMGIGPGNI